MSRDLAREMVAETVPASVARLRRFAVTAVAELVPDLDDDVVALLVSEIATNALVHGAGQVRLRVTATGSGVRIEVEDGSPALPTRRRADTLDEGGRGMALVDELSTRWGTAARPDGKSVWFELDR